MKIGVPSGIGDFSWIWSKLYHVQNQIEGILIADGWPYRTKEYVELCGIPADYGSFGYPQILLNERVNGFESWQQIIKTPADMILLEANKHLEAGKRLEDWLPDLRTNFHYPLNISEGDKRAAQRLVKGQRLVGISCASYRGSEAWKTWNRSQWVYFLQEIMKLGWNPIILGGFWDDLSSYVAATLKLPDLVGRTAIGEAIAIQDRLDAYIGFSSGLGVIRTVLNKTAMMFWPEHQIELSTSWAPPDMLRDRRYIACQWLPVDDVLPITKEYLDLQEVDQRRIAC